MGQARMEACRILKAILEEMQDKYVTGLCGSRYAHGKVGYRFERAGTYRRWVTTSLGRIRLRLIKIRDLA
jgi:hypothetical protein